jgi:glycerol kinase
MIDRAAKSGELAAHADPTQNIYLVPAFVGLGAPHWDAGARARSWPDSKLRSGGVRKGSAGSVAFQPAICWTP